MTVERPPFPGFIDKDFQDAYMRWKPYTMVSWIPLYMSYQAAKHIARHDVPGAIVECGVYKGGCSVIMAEALQANGAGDRDVYMYDTFEGMPEPGEEDDRVDDGPSAREEYFQRKQQGAYDWCAASQEEVQGVVASSAYPTERFKLIKGMVEDTIPATVPDSIALLRLDTDWYASTLHELEHLYPRLSRGGILIVDDYGFWAGATKAVHEYLDRINCRSFLYVCPYSGRAMLTKE